MIKHDLVARWEQAKAALDDARKAEAALRSEVIEAHFNGLQPGNNVAEDEQVRIEVRTGDTIKVDATLPEEWRSNRMFRTTTKVELNKAEYNKLGDEQKRMVEQYLTIKPAAPSFKLTRKEEPAK